MDLLDGNAVPFSNRKGRESDGAQGARAKGEMRREGVRRQGN